MSALARSTSSGPRDAKKPENKWLSLMLVCTTCVTSSLISTSTWLVKNYDKIAVEDLNVSGMLRNRNLSKSIQDASWGGFLSKLKYKVENTQFLNTEGVELYQIGRFEPSSKTCCRCGVVRAKLPLSERIFRLLQLWAHHGPGLECCH